MPMIFKVLFIAYAVYADKYLKIRNINLIMWGLALLRSKSEGKFYLSPSHPPYGSRSDVILSLQIPPNVKRKLLDKEDMEFIGELPTPYNWLVEKKPERNLGKPYSEKGILKLIEDSEEYYSTKLEQCINFIEMKSRALKRFAKIKKIIKKKY